MNYHSDLWIKANVYLHLSELLGYFDINRIVGIFYQGSGNYGLDTFASDVDTKVVLVPSLNDIVINKKLISTTHIRSNNDHIDLKDIRLMFNCFRKQNINFLEILFTKYSCVNPMYEAEWAKLVERREDIARYYPYAAIKTMAGTAKRKYEALKHHTSEKEYDPKQLMDLLRVEEFLERYVSGERYEDCLQSEKADYLKEVKNRQHLKYSFEEAKKFAQQAMNHIDSLVELCMTQEDKDKRNAEVDVLLDNVQFNIITTALKKELDSGLHK